MSSLEKERNPWDWERKQTISVKDVGVVLFVNSGDSKVEMTTREMAKRIWEDMDKYEERSVPRWVINRVSRKFQDMRKWNYVEVVNDILGKGKNYTFRLTKHGMRWAKYHYENNLNNLLVSV